MVVSRSRFWRTGAIMFLIVVGGLSLLPYLISDGAREDLPEAPFADSRFAELDGFRVHYRVSPAQPADAGAVQGDLLLLHGLAGSSFSWREVVEPLTRAGYRVIRVDLPPFGFSEPRLPAQAGLGETALLEAVLDEAGLATDRLHLVGHSMGAAAAARLATRLERSIATVTFVSGSLDTGSEGGQGIGGVIMRYPPVQRWITVIGSRRLLNEEGMARALESAYGKPPSDAAVAGYLAPLRTRGRPAAVIRYLHSSRESVSPDSLGSLQTALIWGERDQWVPISHGRRLQDALDAPLEIIDGAGHNPMETHPEAFSETLLELLAR
ncbi:alpha/beta hydrolase [Gammaproteobacteria bacterium AB-CW1]|uniref:Alpha/beta hydrolase n=1 Tax=Natronospira elongata TaxID=3110268 RepID=A0AAP6JFI0_9GAMM|nr:alpha/beta hydrolase [Gammaproteobacteria bacterium AB-CW1]